ncbi:hypothetical protein ACWDHW_28235 [Streptomyces melanosporofaciens]
MGEVVVGAMSEVVVEVMIAVMIEVIGMPVAGRRFVAELLGSTG